VKIMQKSLIVFFLTLASLNLGAQAYPFELEKIMEGWSNPWGMEFLPDGSALITEKAGRLWLWDGATSRSEITGVPSVALVGQGGLLDVALDPDFLKTPYVYLSYSVSEKGAHGTRIGRGLLKDKKTLINFEMLWDLPLRTSSGPHFGSRLAFGTDGLLFFSVGDRGAMERAQNLQDGAGKIHRIHKDGRIPSDNPLVGKKEFMGSIWSWGHRNVQGLTVAPDGTLWATEHGPQGGDEINLVEKGKNYGWPIITYGKQYGSGANIGEGTHKEGLEQPRVIWTPSIAPSGLVWYAGKAFPDWAGSLLSGNLAGQRLVQIPIANQWPGEETQYLQGQVGRIRELAVDSKGFLYLLTDGPRASLYRIVPKKRLAQ